MSAGTVLTLGLGAFTGGGVAYLPTLGFGTGAAPAPEPTPTPEPVTSVIDKWDVVLGGAHRKKRRKRLELLLLLID